MVDAVLPEQFKIRMKSILGEEYEIDPKEFLSMGKSTPFEGMKVYGRCICTVYDGKLVYASDKLLNG